MSTTMHGQNGVQQTDDDLEDGENAYIAETLGIVMFPTMLVPSLTFP